MDEKNTYYNCPFCGALLLKNDKVCFCCQKSLPAIDNNTSQEKARNTVLASESKEVCTLDEVRKNKIVSSKSKGAALALCFFLGIFGAHRFYANKVGTGVLYLFTGGLFGIGAIVDFIMILCGSFRDKSEAYICDY